MDLSILDTDIDSIDLIQKIFEEYDKHGDGSFDRFCHEIFENKQFRKSIYKQIEYFIQEFYARNIHFGCLTNLLFCINPGSRQLYPKYDDLVKHDLLRIMFNIYGKEIFESDCILDGISHIIHFPSMEGIKFCHENIQLDILKKCLATLRITRFKSNEVEYLQWLEYVNDNICQLHEINVCVQIIPLDNIYTDFLKIAYGNDWLKAFEYLLSVGYKINLPVSSAKIDRYVDILVSNGWQERDAVTYLTLKN